MNRSTTLRPLGKALVVLLALTMFATMGCNMVTTLFGSRQGGAKELWSDVPKIDGLKSENLDLPLAARLAIQAAFQGSIDYASFTTDQTPADVMKYYTSERMQEAGWKSDEGMGCVGDASSGEADAGSVCFFVKEAGGKKEGLALVAGKDDATKKTQLFFARIDLSKLATPTP